MIIIIALGVAGWIYFKNKKEQEVILPQTEDQKIAEQLKNLESLREQYNVQPISETEVKQQLQKLGELRQQTAPSASAPAPVKLSEEQIKQQLEALEKLRNQ